MVIRNFLFHRVTDEKDPMWPPMKPALFSRIIDHLTKNYQVVPLETWLQDPGSVRSNKKLATVLFDDGYKDNIEYAAPILREYKCPASFYVVTDCINKNIPTWTYTIDHVFRQTKKEKVQLDLDFAPEKFRSFNIIQDGTRSSVISEIKPWLKKISNSQRLSVMDSILAQLNDVPPATNKMMNWQDVKQLHNDGFIIGSHSHTHPMLASLEDENEIRQELRSSFETLAGKVTTPLSISYPIGSFDERVIRMSTDAGYKFGLAVKQQFYRTESDPVMEIPRVEIYQEPWWKVQLRMNGIYSRVKKILN